MGTEGTVLGRSHSIFVISSCAMPSKKKAPDFKEDASYAVGDRLKANLHNGRIVDTRVKAVIDRAGEQKAASRFRKRRDCAD